MGTELFTESTPQLLEKFLRPFFGSFRVPSGKIIREVPFFSFLGYGAQSLRLYFLNKQVWKLVNIIIILYLLILTLSIIFLEII